MPGVFPKRDHDVELRRGQARPADMGVRNALERLVAAGQFADDGDHDRFRHWSRQLVLRRTIVPCFTGLCKKHSRVNDGYTSGRAIVVEFGLERIPTLTTEIILRTLLTLAGLAALSLASLDATAADGPHAFRGKAALYSEYEFRGIAQSSEDPALQLTLDYTHASGFHAGTFLSNVKWLEDTGEVLGIPTDAKLEWQIRAGYRRAVAPGWTVDLGAVRYEYPSSRSFGTALGRPDTTEVYAGVSWGAATLKYSHATTELFGVPDSKGSSYLELAVNQP